MIESGFEDQVHFFNVDLLLTVIATGLYRLLGMRTAASPRTRPAEPARASSQRRVPSTPAIGGHRSPWLASWPCPIHPFRT